MKQFPSDIKFKYDWRKYQQRVLDELEGHLDDNHLHIIAPPGSGKTILGLEVAIQLNKPTLIFAPTVAIRNQWIHRFCELFLQVNQIPDWISRDIKKPKFLTVATYQSLHAACSGSYLDEENEDFEENNTHGDSENNAAFVKNNEIIELLETQCIGTIVVDEAHHLKNAWWQSLIKVKNKLNPTIVGLTATPPYDVTHLEWQRYIELNGPVDAEISVPELVVEGDLCPHQDYVFFSKPTIKERHKINDYRKRIESLFNEIKTDLTLIKALEEHPIYQVPNEQLDWIYSNLEYYSATLIFLNAINKKITRDHLEIIGDKNLKIPELNYEWIEILLTFYLYKDPYNFEQYEEHQNKLINKLKRNGAMERHSVNFSHSTKINGFLSSSTSKLKSIEQIVEFEHNQLKQDLRMVILTDYIRKEFLINESKNDLELNKIGVLPIFEQLRRANNTNIKIGVLTGSLIIIPTLALDLFKEISAKKQIYKISTTVLPFDSQYIIINSSEKLKHDIVHIITEVFQKGQIEVLVGTKSLLGEGWDAPSINSLILASFVGSYVLSNQMRGRAIRTEQQNIHKTGNIWHLVCVDKDTIDGGDDIQLLKRRFKAFVGVSFKEEVSIENGIGRLDLSEQLATDEDIAQANFIMLSNAGQRNLLKKKWRQALENGASLIEEIKVPFTKGQEYTGLKSLYYNRTIAYMLAMLGSMFLALGEFFLEGLARSLKHIKSPEDFLRWLTIVGVIMLVIVGKQLFKTIRMYIKYRDISKDIHQIGETLLETLIKMGSIQTDYSELTVVSNVDELGAIYCHLEGGTTYEKSTFIKSLQDIIGSVKNPRYIIIRKSFFLKVFSQRDYHSVPELIGRKKQFAEYFERQWQRFVGACDLIYTRKVEGRKLLLKSRMSSLASEFDDKTERINKWR